MIEALPSVEAPKDFNFQLKARIANAKPGNIQPRWWHSLRYVAPVFAAALILTLIFASQNFFVSDQQVARDRMENPVSNPSLMDKTDAAVVTETPREIETATAPTEPNKTENIPAKPAEKESAVLVKNSGEKKSVPTPKTTENEDLSGSRDFSSKRNQILILPRGLEVNDLSEKSPEDKESQKFTAEQILSEIGIEIATENGKQRVKTVKTNSVADISGVKVGDTIEAIDDQKIGNQPSAVKSVGTKKLTVIRGQEKVEINLRAQ